MPFNKELEDFAQAFSSGYAGAKSPNEREAEKLNLEKGRLEVERLPTQYAHEDTEFGLRVEGLQGQLTDAEAARQRAKITNKYEDDKHALDMQYNQGLIDKQQRDAAQAKIDEERNAAKFKLDQQLSNLQIKGAQEDLTRKQEDNSPAMKEARATVARAEARSKEIELQLNELKVTPASLARDEEIRELELEKAKNDAASSAATTRLTNAQATGKEQENANAFNFADFYNNQAGSDVDFGTQAVPEGPASSTGVDPNTGMNTGAGPRIGGSVPGPTSAVDVPSTTTVASAAAVPPESPPGSEAIVGTFNPPDLVGPYEGANSEAAPPEAPPEEAVPADTGGMSIDAELGAPDMRSPSSAPGSVYPTSPKADPAQATLQKAKTTGKVTIPDLIDIGIKVTPEALKNSAEMSGLMGNESAVDTPETDQMHANWLNGANGADPATAEMVLATMDEATDGKLNPKERLMATIGAGYLYHSAKGEPEKAKGYAIGMVEYGRHLAGQYSAFAKAAAHSGDPDATAMAAMRAYAHVGNGKSLDVSRAPDGEHFIAHITDLKTGKTILKQLMTPDEVMAQAMKTTPDAVVPEMLSAAGIEDKTVGDEAAAVLSEIYHIPAEQISRMPRDQWTDVQGGLDKKMQLEEGRKPKPLSVDDLQQASTMIDTAFSSLRGEDPNLAKVTRDPTVQQVLSQSEENYSSDFKRAAMDIMAQNPNTLPDTAVEAASNMMFKHVDVTPVAKKEGDTNEYVEIRAPGLPPLKVSREYYRTMVAIRSKMLNEAVQQAGDEVQDQQDARKSWNKAASDAAKLFGVGKVKAPPEKELQESIQETIGRPGDITERAKQSGMHSEAVPTTPMEPAYVPPKSVIPQDGKTWYERVFSY